jgi:hypothetical protein
MDIQVIERIGAASLHIGIYLDLGESVTKFDAQLAAYRPALGLAEDSLKSYQHQGNSPQIRRHVAGSRPADTAGLCVVYRSYTPHTY